MSFLALTHLVDYDEGFEIFLFTSLLNISSYFTLLYLRLRNLLDYDYDIYQHHVPIVKSLEIEKEITVLDKKIRKSGSRRIARVRTINGIIRKKEIFIYLFIHILHPYAA